MRSLSVRSALTALVLAVLVVGCDQPRLSDPDAVLRPGNGPAFSSGGNDELVEGDDGEGLEAVALIGSEGGTLKILGHDHTLIVPAGAVAGPTTFRMKLAHPHFIEVDLSAYAIDPLSGLLVNVGERGFAVPLTLNLTYRSAKATLDPTRLRIFWVRPDGIKEPVPSTVNAELKIVSGRLDHFSGYAIGTE